MSRVSLHRPRLPRAVWDRPANGTRLLPTPHSRLAHSLRRGIPLALSEVEGSQERNGWGLLPSHPLHFPHYKRCAKALRLRLRSDQSLSPPVPVTGYGRFPDKNRHALGKGPCQVRAPLIRRIRFASSGDAPEHGVMSLPRAIVPPWAIAPCSDSPGLDLAGEPEQSDERRLKTNAPFKDSTVVTIGELRSTNAGHGSTLPSLRVVEHFRWFRLPRSEYPSRLSTSPRKSGAVALASPMCNIRWSGQPTSAQASTPSCATVRDLPSPPPCPHHPPLLHPLTVLKVRLRREQRRRIERIEAPTKAPTTHERNRLLAHTPIISHAHPFPSPGTPFPRKARNICLEQSNRHELLIKTIKCRRFGKAANPTHRAAHRYRLMSIL